MNFDDYRAHDAVGLAALVKAGEVSAAELLDLALERAVTVNPRLNAIVQPMEDLARERASHSLSGPFAGVPFLTKDLFQDYAGVPTAYGCQALAAKGYRPTGHAEITRRWLDAGLVIFGRTNTPEFGAKGITEPSVYGPCRNPWNPEHTPGGSSGGSAAAVASGIVPVAGGNDGGGSIRIPAACCGLFGLKPSRGRTPWGPDYGELMHGAVSNHVLSRSVRDSAALLDATLGPDPASSYHIENPERSYLEEVGRDPGRLRIGFLTESPIGTPVDPEAAAAVDHTVQLLNRLGHEVEPTDWPVDGRQLARDFLHMWFAHCAATVDEVRARTGCGRSGFEDDTLTMAAFGRALRAHEYVEGVMRWSRYTRQLAEYLQGYDLLLTPTLAAPPARIGELVTPDRDNWAIRVLEVLGLTRMIVHSRLIEERARDNLSRTPYTQLANLTGTPAMSVPLYWTESGLPMGVQFVGPVGGEGLLFRLAGQLEQASPWADRRPEEL